jgi:hypothetical protein
MDYENSTCSVAEISLAVPPARERQVGNSEVDVTVVVVDVSSRQRVNSDRL